MKLLAIILIIFLILILWVITHIIYKPIYDKISKQYVNNEDDFIIANICIAAMLCLSFVIGLLL